MSSSAIHSSPSAAIQRQSPTGSRNVEDLITYCCVCFLPVTSNVKGSTGGNDPQFWLTSCGHIVCGLHCFPDGVPQDAAKTTHTCPYCSSGGISLADLGAGKASLELRDYFRPEAELLEDVAGAIKFRMNNVIRIASHYKALAEKLQGKVDDQRRVLLKVKDELVEGKELKKKKSIMEAEITHLRKEVSQLRAQLSSAQLASLDYDGSGPAQDQYRSEAGTIRQNLSSSPVTAVPENNNLHKRKADDIGGDPAFRAREFRDEMNKRQAMPPPPLALSAQHIEQQYPDNIREEQYNGQGQEQYQEHRSEYSNQPQNLEYSPQQQMYGNEPAFGSDQPTRQNRRLECKSATAQQSFPVDSGRQFIDLTGSTVTSMQPPPLPGPRSGFLNQHQQGGSQLQGRYARNVNVPFRSPLRTSTPRPASSLPVRGTGDGYFMSPNHQLPRSGIRYGNNMPPFIQGNGANFISPIDQAESFSSLKRQGEGERYHYSGAIAPSTPRTSKRGESGVVSSFFSGPLATPRSPRVQLPTIGNGIPRPASVGSFVGQQGNLDRSYGAGLGESGFFSRQNDSFVGEGGLSDAVGAPTWGTPQFGKNVGSFRGGREVRPGTVQGFGRSGGGNIFGPQRGAGSGFGGAFQGGIGSASRGGAVGIPGLRRSVKRD